MSEFNDTYRIFGEELDVSETFIDVKVVDYSINGMLRLEDNDNNEFHDVPITNMNDWQEKDLLLAHSNMPMNNLSLWQRMQDLRWSANNESLGPVTDEVKEMEKELFKKTVRANRAQS